MTRLKDSAFAGCASLVKVAVQANSNVTFSVGAKSSDADLRSWRHDFHGFLFGIPGTAPGTVATRLHNSTVRLV